MKIYILIREILVAGVSKEDNESLSPPNPAKITGRTKYFVFVFPVLHSPVTLRGQNGAFLKEHSQDNTRNNFKAFLLLENKVRSEKDGMNLLSFQLCYLFWVLIFFTVPERRKIVIRKHEVRNEHSQRNMIFSMEVGMAGGTFLIINGKLIFFY